MKNIAVKICGITEYQDALWAVELGAAALGFILASSPRQITPQKARNIIKGLPCCVKTVGVFVNEAVTAIREIKHYCSLDLVQLHGNESPHLCYAMMPYSIKALNIKDESSLQKSRQYQGKVRALLLDTYSEDKAGGTGKTFDWDIAISIKRLGMPVILSGGLGPSNIERAIRTVGPYAVDVNSGVEKRPGRKSYSLMRDLTEKVIRATIPG